MRNPNDIIINSKQLSEILDLHKKWVLDQVGGERAYLQGADLRGAYLRGAYLQGADLQGADLQGADLQGAYLRGAYLQGADLQGADLQGAYLQGADLQGADLQGADLQGAKNTEAAEAYTCIVPDGEIIGWKKCVEGVVRILVPMVAKRSNASGRKCRAEWAIDLQHFDKDGKETDAVFHSDYNHAFEYHVGKEIRPNSFDENRWNECSNGVHFFITRWEAEHYN